MLFFRPIEIGFSANIKKILLSFFNERSIRRSLQERSQKLFASTANSGKALIVLFALTLVSCVNANAQAVEITTQPKSKLVQINTQANLSVSANVSDGGILLYEWYSNTVESNVGGTLVHTTVDTPDSAFEIPSEQTGDFYYYVVVSSTNENSTQEVYASVTSKVAKVTVTLDEVYTISFFDDKLNKVEEETVLGGTIRPSSILEGTWYALEESEPTEEVDVDENISFFETSGVIGISTEEDLDKIRDNLAGRYILQNSITVNPADDVNGWLPIGSYADGGFKGALNGNGHAIKGLWINRPNEDYIGLFGYIGGGGSILYLGIDTDAAKGGIQGRDYVGAVAGRIRVGTITAVRTGADVRGRSYVGGITGRAAGSLITITISNGDISGTGDYVGGVVGRVDIGTITATYSTGKISGDGDYVGGVVGYSGEATITATYSAGKVGGGGDYVGGVTGYISIGTITASYSRGEISGAGDYVGGIAGYAFLVPVTAVYTQGNVVGNNYVGGVVGSFGIGTLTAAFSYGDILGNYFAGRLVGRNKGSIITASAGLGRVKAQDTLLSWLPWPSWL
ncbi:MAG: hypothetical protein LBQ18_01555 [Campylobacteraceae bacterium]|jgi:hypothetical protein|nr:hypothetical protein [Campylobacteraceae bacterium]